MPVEPMTLLLRPRNFFTNNPVMNVPPSYVTIPSQIAAEKDAVVNASDKLSNLAFNGPIGSGNGNGMSCCSGTNSASRAHL